MRYVCGKIRWYHTICNVKVPGPVFPNINLKAMKIQRFAKHSKIHITKVTWALTFIFLRLKFCWSVDRLFTATLPFEGHICLKHDCITKNLKFFISELLVNDLTVILKFLNKTQGGTYVRILRNIL